MSSRNVVVDETSTTGVAVAAVAITTTATSTVITPQYETICSGALIRTQNLITSNDIIKDLHIRSRNDVTRNNNDEMPSLMMQTNQIVHWNGTEMDATKKPPILPTKRASVINLDKNRIRHGRRILPRPLSLPNSFNLIRNFKSHEEPKFDDVTTVDISVIKELEDEIYKRKEEILQQKKEFVQKKLCLNKNCSNCTSNFIPNQVIEEKIIDLNETSAMRSPNSQPVLLLDTWQMEPLLLKYDKPSTSTTNVQINGDEKKSILIVDNSTYYPTLIKYEINASRLVPKQPSLFLSAPILDKKPITDKNPPNNDSRQIHGNNKNFAQQLLERCLGKSFDPDYAVSEPHEKQTPLSDDESNDKNVSTKKLSKFKRFILQRRSLNLSTNKIRTSSSSSSSTNNITVPPIVTRVPPVNSCGYDESSCSDIDVEQSSTANHISSSINSSDKRKLEWNHDIGDTAAAASNILPPIRNGVKSKLNRNKLNFLLLMKRQRDNYYHHHQATSKDAKNSLNNSKRKWKSLNDIVTKDNNNTDEHKSIDLIYQNAFSGISWSQMDIVDIIRSTFVLNNFDLIATNRSRLNSEFPISKLRDKSHRHSYAQQRTRLVKRRSSFRQNKRHSVGSPTDVVKTWVYRRRYITFIKDSFFYCRTFFLLLF